MRLRQSVRPIPIPDGLAEAVGGRRVVIGEPGDPTREDVRPCEYIVRPSSLYQHANAYSSLIELDDAERALLAAGARLMLTLDGAEVPWSIGIVP